MDDERPPKKPVIGSQASALAEIERWMRENRHDLVEDADGLAWRLSIETEERAARLAPRELEIELRFHLQTSVTPEDLIRTRTLDPVADARLLSLIEGETIPLVVKPVVRVAAGLEDARRIVRDELPRLKAKLTEASSRDLKRALVARWLEKISVFGRLDPVP
jgi:hypothetical protein